MHLFPADSATGWTETVGTSSVAAAVASIKASSLMSVEPASGERPVWRCRLLESRLCPSESFEPCCCVDEFSEWNPLEVLWLDLRDFSETLQWDVAALHELAVSPPGAAAAADALCKLLPRTPLPAWAASLAGWDSFSTAFVSAAQAAFLWAESDESEVGSDEDVIICGLLHGPI